MICTSRIVRMWIYAHVWIFTCICDTKQFFLATGVKTRTGGHIFRSALPFSPSCNRSYLEGTKFFVVDPDPFHRSFFQTPDLIRDLLLPFRAGPYERGLM